MEKITAVILAALAAASAISAGSYTLGDTDENGIIDGRDATLVLTEYAQTSTGRESGFSDLQNKAADVDENNIIDGRDASWILSYYAYISANGGEMDLRRFIKGEPAEPITEAPITYDYTLENITQSADVFNRFAGHMNGQILHGSSILLEDCNENEYWTYGDREAKVALLLMNDNISYNDGVLSNVFEGYSDEEIKNGALYLYRIAMIEEYTKVDVDFNNYILDKNISNYMNNLRNAARIARETGNCDELNNVLYLFTEDENYQYLQNNYAALMLTIGYGSRIENNNYYTIFDMMSGWDLNNYENESSEIVKKLINQSTGG